jgi:hypothetical protein
MVVDYLNVLHAPEYFRGSLSFDGLVYGNGSDSIWKEIRPKESKK